MPMPRVRAFARTAAEFREHHVQAPLRTIARSAPDRSRSGAVTRAAEQRALRRSFPAVRGREPGGARTLPELMRRNGLTTTCIGKISHTPDGRVSPTTGRATVATNCRAPGTGSSPPSVRGAAAGARSSRIRAAPTARTGELRAPRRRLWSRPERPAGRADRRRGLRPDRAFLGDRRAFLPRRGLLQAALALGRSRARPETNESRATTPTANRVRTPTSTAAGSSVAMKPPGGADSPPSARATRRSARGLRRLRPLHRPSSGPRPRRPRGGRPRGVHGRRAVVRPRVYLGESGVWGKHTLSTARSTAR